MCTIPAEISLNQENEPFGFFASEIHTAIRSVIEFYTGEVLKLILANVSPAQKVHSATILSSTTSPFPDGILKQKSQSIFPSHF